MIHLRQLSLLGMIARLPGSLLHQHAVSVFTKQGNTWSWFHQVRNICLRYQLPHPLTFLTSPLSKDAFKRMIKKNVVNYWELKLRDDAAPLKSLKYFKPQFMSLSKPHPIFSTAGSSPYEVVKACTQARLLSGRYRTELLSSHWSSNPGGYCLCPSCDGLFIPEDIEHIFLHCDSLGTTRLRLSNFTMKYAQDVPLLCSTILELTKPCNPLFLQFLLDCSVIPKVISLCMEHGNVVLHHMFKVSRTWCYSLHRERLKLLGRWNPY